MLLQGLVGFLVLLTAEARIGNSSDLPYCTETKECLVFDLICQTPEYEVRRYDSVKWVSTREEAYFMEMATTRAFKRLFKYITGANEDGSKIDMTTPVITMVQKKFFWEPSVFTLSFLLPAEYQENPPPPSDPKVYFNESPDMKVYVKTYGGWTTAWADMYKARKLTNSLDLVGAKYNQQFHYAVGYNSPMTLFNRHNEVWIVAEDDHVCSSSTSSSEESG